MLIIGITGTIGAGKGTVVDYLKAEHNLTHHSARDFIVEEIEKRNMLVDRDSMTLVSNDLRQKHGPFHIAESLYKKAKAHGNHAIIESLRTTGEISFLRDLASEKAIDTDQKKLKFILLAVDAPIEMRYERILLRASITDHISFQKFKEDNEREMMSTDPHKQNLASCIVLADTLIINDSTIENLFEQIDRAIAEHMN